MSRATVAVAHLVFPRRTTVVLATAFWLIAALMFLTILLPLQALTGPVWLQDWNEAFYSGWQLLDRSLYQVAFVAPPGVVVPIDYFNFPPFAAAIVVPLLPLGREASGTLFVIATGLLTAVGLALAGRALRLPSIVAPAAAVIYLAVWPYVMPDIALGNLNPLIFMLVAAFAWAHLEGRPRAAGVLLGLAVAIKLWPIALVVVLVRDRSWESIRWMLATIAVVTLPLVAWLGAGAIPAMVHGIVSAGLQHRDAAVVPVLWTTAFWVWWDWWPSWGTYVVAATLLLLPARGRLGIGLGILAGLALKSNIWDHYVWAFGLGLVFVAAGVRAVQAELVRRGAVDTTSIAPPRPGTRPSCEGSTSRRARGAPAPSGTGGPTT